MRAKLETAAGNPENQDRGMVIKASIGLVMMFSLAAGFVATLLGLRGISLGMGLLAGFLGHTLLDMTNTYGVAWLAPFSRRRCCLEWVFFIDAIVLVGLAAALAFVIPMWLRQGFVPGKYALAFFGFLSLYVLAKGVLRRRAGAYYPTSKSLVPSALVPWRFYGTQRQQHNISLFRVNAITGAYSTLGEGPVLDEPFASTLKDTRNFGSCRSSRPNTTWWRQRPTVGERDCFVAT